MMGPVDEVEGDLAALSEFLTALRAGECLFCYAYRMMTSLGCDGTLRWAQRWRDMRAPRATGLERMLGSSGGFCDCEIFMNGLSASSAITIWDPEADDEVWPDPMPPWPGLGPRSTQPCGLWSQKSRGFSW